MKNSKSLRLVALLLVLLSISFAGCQSTEDKILTKWIDEDVYVIASGNKMVIIKTGESPKDALIIDFNKKKECPKTDTIKFPFDTANYLK